MRPLDDVGRAHPPIETGAANAAAISNWLLTPCSRRMAPGRSAGGDERRGGPVSASNGSDGKQPAGLVRPGTGSNSALRAGFGLSRRIASANWFPTRFAAARTGALDQTGCAAQAARPGFSCSATDRSDRQAEASTQAACIRRGARGRLSVDPADLAARAQFFVKVPASAIAARSAALRIQRRPPCRSAAGKAHFRQRGEQAAVRRGRDRPAPWPSAVRAARRFELLPSGHRCPAARPLTAVNTGPRLRIPELRLRPTRSMSSKAVGGIGGSCGVGASAWRTSSTGQNAETISDSGD